MKSENVIQYPISPWHGDSFGSFELPSPDGQVVAIFTQLTEIAMGAPVGSPLTIGGREIEGHFSPSAIWSEDSKYLALPKWIWGGPHHRTQNFAIYCLRTKQLHVTEERFSVLLLESFNAGIVRGYNSPRFKIPFEFHISQFGLE